MLNDDIVSVEFDISKETAEKVNQLVKNRLWDKDKGLRIIFGCGLGYLFAEDIVKNNDADKITTLSRELALCEGKFSAASYELADYKRMVHRWELSSGSIKTMGAALEKVALDQREQIAELKKRNQELLAENEKLKAQVAGQQVETGIPSSNKISILDRIKQALGRG